MQNPFRYFNSSHEVIRLTVMMYICYPLSLRQVEDHLFERGIDVCHETVRFWRNRFGPMFAAEIRKRRVHHRSYSQWRWHLGDVFVRINGATHYLWRAVDHEVKCSRLSPQNAGIAPQKTSEAVFLTPVRTASARPRCSGSQSGLVAVSGHIPVPAEPTSGRRILDRPGQMPCGARPGNHRV